MCIHNTDSTGNYTFRHLLKKFFIVVYMNFFNQQKNINSPSLVKKSQRKEILFLNYSRFRNMVTNWRL